LLMGLRYFLVDKLNLPDDPRSHPSDPPSDPQPPTQ
jgi:hypothetical protein